MAYNRESNVDGQDAKKLYARNLNSYKHNVVSNILRFTQLLDLAKVDVSISSVIHWSCWPLKCHQVGFGNQGFADVATKLTVLRLVKDGEGNQTSERPLQDAIPLTLHHVYKQGDMAPQAAVNSIQVDPHAHLVAIQTRVERRAVDRCHCVAYCIFATLSEILDPPYVCTITHTSFVLHQFGLHL